MPPILSDILTSEVAFSFTKEIMSFLKSINPFHKPEAKDIINDTLEEYRRKAIDYTESAAYSKKMAEFYQEGIARLTKENNG